MVGLPDGIRAVRFAPVNQFEGIAVSFTSLMGKGDEIGGELAYDVVNHRIARGRLSKILRQPAHLAAQRRNRQRRLLHARPSMASLIFCETARRSPRSSRVLLANATKPNRRY